MVKKPRVEKQDNFCPYCDEKTVEGRSYCDACGVKIFYCPRCHKPVERTRHTCPNCGTAIKGEEP